MALVQSSIYFFQASSKCLTNDCCFYTDQRGDSITREFCVCICVHAQANYAAWKYADVAIFIILARHILFTSVLTKLLRDSKSEWPCNRKMLWNGLARIINFLFNEFYFFNTWSEESWTLGWLKRDWPKADSFVLCSYWYLAVRQWL